MEKNNMTTYNVTKNSPDYLMEGKTSEIVPVLLIKKNLEKDRDIALLNSTKNFEKNKKIIDKKRKLCKIKEDGFVFVDNGNKVNRNKLNEVRSGPYRVIKQVSDTMFVIDCSKKIGKYFPQ